MSNGNVNTKPSSDMDSPQPESQSSIFAYGCCVPTVDLMWMIIVLFIFTACVLIFCCCATTFVRWVYKRRMRKKADQLREKYRQEEKFKREMDVKLKEIAMRPQLQNFKHHRGDTKREQNGQGKSTSGNEKLIQHLLQQQAKNLVVSTQKTPTIKTAEEVKQMNEINDVNNTNLASQMDRNYFTGLTNLASSSTSTMSPSVISTSPLTINKTPKITTTTTTTTTTRDTVTTLPSTSPTSASPIKSSAGNVMAAPIFIAQVTHQIAKMNNATMTKPDENGIILRSTNTQPKGLSSADQMESLTDYTVIGLSNKKLSNTTGPTSDTVTVSPHEMKRNNDRSKRKKIINPDGYGRAESIMPNNTSFPYWSAQRILDTIVEDDISPSGRIRSTTVESREKTKWKPSRNELYQPSPLEEKVSSTKGLSTQSSDKKNSITSAISQSNKSNSSIQPQYQEKPILQPMNAYDLRKEKEKQEEAQITEKARNILESRQREREGKNNSSSDRPLILPHETRISMDSSSSKRYSK